jgi:transposase
MELYAGIDLHSTNNQLGIIDSTDRRIFKKKLRNDPQIILDVLSPFKGNLKGIVVESTFNWYWIVDLLMDHGYRIHLANPSAIQQYKGLKYSDDKHDAFWLAHMLQLGILPEGYIYPKEDRPIRDLLRKRRHLVRLRTDLILSLQGIVQRNCGFKVNVNDIKAIKENRVQFLLSYQEDLALSGSISKETIDFLTKKIWEIEQFILNKVRLKDSFRYLSTICGVGKILALTIMLETGIISRFQKVGDFVSYCRKVPTDRITNGKSKGKGNKKNGNKYLCWAFSEAAEFARRYDPHARAFYNRKISKKHRLVAHSSLAAKLARAAYIVMKRKEPFDPLKLFA